MTGNARIRGPILSVANLQAHIDFFCGPLGFSETAAAEFSVLQTSALLSVDDVSLQTKYLQHAQNQFGVRLWCFSPSHPGTVRSPDRGTDRDALKVVDIYAQNFDDALVALGKAGYEPKSEIAAYELPEGQFREAHLWRPDNVVCAILTGPRDFFSRFVSSQDGLFSEPQSISAPVTRVAAVLEFYREVFSFEPLYRYQVSNPSFDALLGSEQAVNLSAINIGADLKEPYLGIIDYGKTVTTGVSLAGNSRPPIRGLLGVEIEVESIDNVLAAAARISATVLADRSETDYPPLGKVQSCVIEGPHGVIHHIVQR